MSFEISCRSCGAVLRTSGARLTACPSCNSPVEGALEGERRSNHDIPSVRDWITDLRVNGADFSRDAAIAAREAAWNARRSGGSVEDAFQSAREAYYRTLHTEEAPVNA
jgi:hypothetical protein